MRICSQVPSDLLQIASMLTGLDPAFTRDPSGCTAVSALVTKDNRIFTVCVQPFSLGSFA